MQLKDFDQVIIILFQYSNVYTPMSCTLDIQRIKLYKLRKYFKVNIYANFFDITSLNQCPYEFTIATSICLNIGKMEILTTQFHIYNLKRM